MPCDDARIVVHHADLSGLTEPLCRTLADRLDADERARAARFAFDEDRRIFIAAHALLRAALHQSLGDQVGDRPLGFRADAYGKPELDPPLGDPPLRFNLTHTRGLAACAIARGHAVGIDAEAIDRVVDGDALAERYFAPAEVAQLMAIPSAARPEAFFRVWTLKEALVKGLGKGLTFPLDSFAFRLEPLALSFTPGAGEDAAWWHVEERAVGGTHRLALVVHRPPGTTLSIEWHAIDVATLA